MKYSDFSLAELLPGEEKIFLPPAGSCTVTSCWSLYPSHFHWDLCFKRHVLESAPFWPADSILVSFPFISFQVSERKERPVQDSVAGICMMCGKRWVRRKERRETLFEFFLLHYIKGFSISFNFISESRCQSTNLKKKNTTTIKSTIHPPGWEILKKKNED